MFITFEGIDGVGKSTQLDLLETWLVAQGKEVIRTLEPGGTELGQEIRHLLLHRKGDVAPRAEALLYAADRAHHVATKIRPALALGKAVLSDRYFDSSVA
jgi:dTMP kinase